MRACRTAFEAGKTSVKLYFMNGLPTETMEDIEGIARLTKKHRVPFLCDAVQAFGHLSLPLHKADFITLSAHKFGGPRGVGCLVARYPYVPGPLIHGGGQELGLRSGTENLPAIAAMALAAQKSKEEPLHTMKELSDLLLNGLRSVAPSVVLNGEGTQRHPGILNLRFPGISGEEMAVRLDLKGICVSPGAACGARDPRPSHVLLAMGCTETQATESVRFSLGRNTTEEEINTAVEAVEQVLRSARKEM